MAFPVKNITINVDRRDLEVLIHWCARWNRPETLDKCYTGYSCMVFLLNEFALRHAPKLLKYQKSYRISIKQSELSAMNTLAGNYTPKSVLEVERILTPILNQI